MAFTATSDRSTISRTAGRLSLALVAFAFAACSDPPDEQVVPTSQSTTPTIAESVVTSTSTTTRPAPLDLGPFQRAIRAFSIEYDTPPRLAGPLIGGSPYFAVATLRAVGAGPIYESVNNTKTRAVALTMDVSDARPLIRSKDYPGPLNVGGTVLVATGASAYTTDADRLRTDGQIAEVVAVAPIGQRFALFLGPSRDGATWLISGPTGWAFVDGDGNLAPVVPYSGPNWTDGRETLASVLSQIATMTAQ